MMVRPLRSSCYRGDVSVRMSPSLTRLALPWYRLVLPARELAAQSKWQRRYRIVIQCVQAKLHVEDKCRRGVPHSVAAVAQRPWHTALARTTTRAATHPPTSFACKLPARWHSGSRTYSWATRRLHTTLMTGLTRHVAAAAQLFFFFFFFSGEGLWDYRRPIFCG